jgi:hypothetical protein
MMNTMGTRMWVRLSSLLARTDFKASGWSLGCVSAIDSNGRTIWIVDAHRDNGKHFVARADEKLTAFMELESAIRKQCCRLVIAQRFD